MEIEELGVLEPIDNIREIWKHEEHDFSKWLFKPENLERLSKEIGIQLNGIEKEAKVGNFSTDILAEDSYSKLPVIIENQLEQSDHEHLGKMITYGAYYDANILIWIFKNIKEEHKKAIEWLNEKTNETLRIFAVKLELWKIGDSKKAVKFNVICSPSGWNNNSKDFNKELRLTPTQNKQLDFWTKFNEYLSKNNSILKQRQPLAANWYTFSTGNSNLLVHCTVYFKNDLLKCNFGIYKKEIYEKIIEKKSEIIHFLGYEASFEEWDIEKKYASISTVIDFDIDNNKEEYYYIWLKERCEKYLEIIPKYI